MLSLPPPPPPPPSSSSPQTQTSQAYFTPPTTPWISVTPSPTPQPRRPRTPASLTQIIKSKSEINQTFWQPQPRRTNPLVWCSAILCFIFSMIIIFFGIATLIIFLVIRPRSPLFDTPNASLTVIYFDAPEYFNGDFTFVANFSNPNRKIDVRFEYLEIELYFYDKLIATQALQPFTQRRGQTRAELVHMISSLVHLPQNHAVLLRKQVMSNRITYNIRGSFKVQASLGLIHYSYWLHGRCQLQMTGPPTGTLVARNCTTKR